MQTDLRRFAVFRVAIAGEFVKKLASRDAVGAKQLPLTGSGAYTDTIGDNFNTCRRRRVPLRGQKHCEEWP